MAKPNVYQIITDRIIAKLEQGTVPWRKSWAGRAGGMPTNRDTGKPYRGINVLLLTMAGYGSRYWVTFRQAQKLGGTVRKGEHGSPVLYWQSRDDDDAGQGDTKRAPIVRYYRLFNLEQCDGIDDPDAAFEAQPFSPIDDCETVIANMPAPPTVHIDGGRAFYQPSVDAVHVPERERFECVEEFYATFFHELVHATGHASRLGRQGIVDEVMFGGHEYSKEELIAEIGACFLCGHTGIDAAVLDNSAAYVQGWLTLLRSDSRLVITAASHAQKAADFILGAA